MRFVSTFSGVEAASVAWERLGWQPLMYSEVDEFACAVLAHRFPEVPNYGDIREIDWKEVNDRYGIIDVYIGGSPCQNFSVAGNRLGLLGTESRLMYEYIRAIKELLEASGGASPRYVVFENVPGALSSGPKGAKGSDFQCLLRELDECGYGLAWRVLDSQFARVFDRSNGRFAGPVPQRRRRVYLVGSLGSDGAGEILFERSCLRGDHPKGREARQALARDSARCAGMGDRAVPIKADTTPKFGEQGDAAFTLCSRENGGGINDAVALQSDGNTSQNSHGGGTPLTAVRTPSTASIGNPSRLSRTSAARSDWRAFDGSHVGALSSNPSQTKGQGQSLIMTQFGEVAGTLRARGDSSPNADGGQNVVCMQDGQAKGAIEEQLSTTLNASHEQPIVCAADDNGKTAIEEDMCGSLKVGGGVALNSNGEGIVGALCARDWKGVGNEYVNEGKVICQRHTC